MISEEVGTGRLDQNLIILLLCKAESWTVLKAYGMHKSLQGSSDNL